MFLKAKMFDYSEMIEVNRVYIAKKNKVIFCEIQDIDIVLI